jgi:epoxyqueuosine reductase
MTSASAIYDIANKLGFDACGIAKLSIIEDQAFYRAWISNGYNGEMSYMSKNIDIRLNPIHLMPEAKSIIMLAINYLSESNNKFIEYSNLKISRYALGKNYHNYIRKKLKHFKTQLQSEFSGIILRPFVDTAPVLEKYWAKKTGIGTIGKNTCLIIPHKGSWFFLAGMLCNIDFVSNTPQIENYCGNCTKCIDACPTKALVSPYVLDSRKCISYLTIEKKGDFFENQCKWSQWIWGCDICQEVCPQNSKAVGSLFTEFELLPQIQQLGNSQSPISEAYFEQHFKGTSLYRGGNEQICRNIAHVKK